MTVRGDDLAGLLERFTVIDNETGEAISGRGELVVVLRPEHDRAALQALQLYTAVARRRSPRLASEMAARLRDIAAIAAQRRAAARRASP